MVYSFYHKKKVHIKRYYFSQKKPLFPSGTGFHKYITFFPRHLKSTALLCCPRTRVKR